MLFTSDLLARHIPHSSGFCGPGCTCPQALPLELGWGVPPPGYGTVCEAGTRVPGSSCGLPEFPWTAEVSGVAVERYQLLQANTTREIKTHLGQTYRGGCRHAAWEESWYFVQLCHELRKLKENDINKCQNQGRSICWDQSSATAAIKQQEKHFKEYHFFVLLDIQGSFDYEVLLFLRIGVLYFFLREGF